MNARARADAARRRTTTRAMAAMDDARASATAVVDAHVARGALTTDDARTLRETIALGQAHLIADWPAPGVDDERKRAFVDEVRRADRGYPGGVAKYVSNARELLRASKEGKNPFEVWYCRPFYSALSSLCSTLARG